MGKKTGLAVTAAGLNVTGPSKGGSRVPTLSVGRSASSPGASRSSGT